MRRREFIAGLGSAAAWPVVARAQQAATPVVGYLSSAAPELSGKFVRAFRKGLSEVGYIEGRNVAIEYRFANNAPARLPELADDLVRRHVSVIATSSSEAAVAAKGATTTIPIVFRTGVDPVKLGLVAQFNKLGGNITGINDINSELGPKRLGLLHALLPKASRVGMFAGPINADSDIPNIRAAASNIGMSVEAIRARTSSDIDSAFGSLVQKGVDALFVTNDALFFNRRVQMVILAAYHRLPAVYALRELVEIGGLASYGSDFSDQQRLAGIYTGRIIQGEKPSEMPVLRPTKFEFVINLQTAKTLRVDVAPTILALADEVIE
jgi:putative ABC transport system substrate-binding protein